MREVNIVRASNLHINMFSPFNWQMYLSISPGASASVHTISSFSTDTNPYPLWLSYSSYYNDHKQSNYLSGT